VDDSFASDQDPGSTAIEGSGGRMPGRGRSRVVVAPLGAVAAAELRHVADLIHRVFGVTTEIARSEPMPARAHRPDRCQYDADLLLDHLFERLTEDTLRLVGVTELDMFADGRNFVFGYAHMRDRVAVYSLCRLREEFWGRASDPPRLRERVLKAVVHELGHTFNTPHCDNPRCVMHQVEHLAQLDALPAGYCSRCASRVRLGLAVPLDGAEALFERASSLMRRRRFAKAVSIYGAAIVRAPHNPSYHNDLGVALLALGDRAAAGQSFTRALELKPDYPHPYYNLGIVARENGEIEQADEYFSEALRREADVRAGHRYLGLLHHDFFHDPVRAVFHLRRYAEMGGNEREVLARLAGLASERAPASPSDPPVLRRLEHHDSR
jgi:archaemetzincin